MLYNVVKDHPIVIAHNRDELVSRPKGSPPAGAIVDGRVIIAPRDMKDGEMQGTWIGFNEYGLVNSLTNVEQKRLNTGARSRGHLVLDGLTMDSCPALEEFVFRELGSEDYNHFNLLYADSSFAYTLQFTGGQFRPKELSDGLHVLPSSQLTNGNNPEKRRERIQEMYHKNEPSADNIEAVLCRIKGICRDHYGHEGSSETVCTHGDNKGTVSSTIIAVNKDIAKSKILYADGPPCQNLYQDYSFLAKRLDLQLGLL